MTTIDTHADVAGDSGVAAFFGGVAAWVTTTDHKRIGRLYLAFGLLGLAAASVIGLVLGLEKSSDSALLDAGSLLQVFQAERVALVFGGLAPMMLGLAIAVVPLQLGARQMAFPRLALTGYYAWLGGLGLTVTSLLRNGGMGGGDAAAVDMFLVGHGLMVLGLLASAGALATSILTTRCPGMTMRRVPLFAWSTLITSLAMLLALPVLFGVIVLVFVDQRIGGGFNFGGPDGVGDWISWIYSTPAAAVFAIPAFGLIAELIPVTFKHRQSMRGTVFAGIALVGVTGLSAVTQQFVHDVTFDNSSFSELLDSLLPWLIFSGLPVLGAMIVFALGARTSKDGVANGTPQMGTAVVFAFFGAGLVLLGLVATALQGITELDLYDPFTNSFTSFELGATLLVVFGCVLSAIGGVTFWAPKLWGRAIPDKQVAPLALLGAGGAALAAIPLCIAGLLGQAGGVADSDAAVAAQLDMSYDSSAELWNWLSLVGYGMMALTIVAFAALMLKVFTGDGETAEQNPFGGHTIEWTAASPAPPQNFEYVPTVASATPVFDMTYEGSLP